jgi:hypothetical protein
MTNLSVHFMSPNIPAGGSAPATRTPRRDDRTRHPKRLSSPPVGRGRGWGATGTTK